MNHIAVEAVREQAARWIVRLNEGELSEAERLELHEWLAQDARHAVEFRAHLNITQLASELPPEAFDETIAEEAPGAVTPAPRAPRRWLLPLAAAAAMALACAGVWFVARDIGPAAAVHLTGTGEQQTVTFEDGSVAYLNTRTRLRWEGDARERRVVLEEGEALFDVIPDAARPFRVIVGNGEVRVLGTRFNVYRRKSGEVQVTVLEGEVEVLEHDRDTSSPAWRRRLAANQQVAFSAIGLTEDVHEVNATNVARWREGVLELSDAPLAVVIDELTRYTDSRILIRDPRLAQLRLGGALSTRDVRAALARIEKLAPIAVAESGKTFTLDFRSESGEQ